MLKLIVIVIALVAPLDPLHAQQPSKAASIVAYKNAAKETIDCAVYYVVVSEALSRDKRDPDAVKRYLETAESLLKRSAILTDRAGLHASTIHDRLDSTRQSIVKKMSGQMSNIAAVTDEFHESCNYLVANPRERLAFWLRQAVK